MLVQSIVTHKIGYKIYPRRSWLNHLTALSLAIWWFDSGSIVSGGRQGCLCTDGFSEGECKILAKYLLVVWGVRARVGPTQKKKRPFYYRLWFSTNQLKLFLNKQLTIGYWHNGLIRCDI